MSLGARIRAARTHRGLTQSAVAAELGVDQTTLSGWEGGRRGEDPDPARATEPRSAPKLIRLAEILRVDLDWLLTGANPPPWFALESAEDAA